jgi:hypothetical protein
MLMHENCPKEPYNFASAVAQEPVSQSWVTRFINKYSIHLISQYSAGMDADRHNADFYSKYELYFNLLQRKIAEYKVDAEHTYNMDEEGFMIGFISRQKHMLNRRMREGMVELTPLLFRTRLCFTLCHFIHAHSK